MVPCGGARFVLPLTVRLDQPVALASLQHCIIIIITIITQSSSLHGGGGDEVPVAHHRHRLQQKAARLQ
jgi:hypothetical protein